MLIAIGNIFGGNPNTITDYKAGYNIWQAAVTLGVYGMSLLPGVMGAAIAYSIADRPGIAPGLLMGMIAQNMGAGFLGGMLGGYLAGYFVELLKKHLKVPKWAQGLMPMMIVPLLASIVIGLVMFFVIGGPIAWALMDGVYGPEAVKICASMIPPFGVALSWLIKRSRYTKSETDNIKIAFPMGICMITEGVIPIAAVDPIRVILSCSVGAAVGGSLIMLLNVGSMVPSGGMFIVPAMINPWGFMIALISGTVVTALLLTVLKKDAKEEDSVVLDEDEEELDLSSVKIG